MSSNLVIVAIPAKDEKVWKVSSEQVPHLTLLFLGENTGDVAKLEQIVEFVDHAVKVEEHGPVMLSVDERGTLGSDEADVLFFEKDYSIKWLSHFRNQLLQQNDIRSAYESVPQYPEWRPHLTLGYPATPAHEDEIPEHGLSWISFDRIAVWTEDFNGPEFKLRWPDRSQDEPCMAMASANDARKALGLDALVKELDIPVEHHGVKGMRWGVRKDVGPNGAHILVSEKTGRAMVSKGVATALVSSAVIMPPVTLAMFLSPRVRAEVKAADTHNKNLAKDAKWHKELNSAKSAVKVHNKAAEEINTKISAFNNDKRWKNKDGTDIDLHTNPAKQSEYDKAVERELINPAFSRAALAVHGAKSPGGRYEFTIKDHSTAEFAVKDTHAQHAANDVVTVTYKIVRDDLGHITGFQIEDSMAQTADRGAEFIEHHGVKGMRWGVRQHREGVLRKQADSLRTKADKTQNAKLGKQRVKDARASRLNKQADRKQAQADHLNRNIQKTGAIRGKIGSGLKRVGKAFSGAMTALADSHWQGSTYSDVKHEAVHNHVAEKLDNHIGRLQNSPKYRGKNLKADSNLRKTYYEDVAKVTESQYRQGVKEVYGQNYTGTKSAHYVTDARGPRIEVRDTKTGEKQSESPLTSMAEIRKRRIAESIMAQSATAIDAPDISIDLILDDNGQISGVGFVKPTDTAQHIAELGAEFIEHHGIKGMHWGVRNRKGTPVAVSPKVTSTVPHGDRRKTKLEVSGGHNHPAHPDAIKVAEARAKLKKSGPHALSNQELRDVANRVQLENQVAVLTSHKGKQFVTRQLQNEGQNLARAGVRSGVKRGVKKVGIAALA